MKRGLVKAVGEDRSTYESRVDRLRDQLREAGVQVALLYGDVYRSDDIAHLTNLCIYWNEGMMAIRPQGPPVLLTKLSPRVFPWMRLTSKAEDIRSGRKFGALVRTNSPPIRSARSRIPNIPKWPSTTE